MAWRHLSSLLEWYWDWSCWKTTWARLSSSLDLPQSCILQFLLAVACGGLIFVQEAFKGYRYLRLIGFLDPFKHISDINLQLYQSLLALGSGGWFGLGLGASRQKTGYLPFPFTDSIFT